MPDLSLTKYLPNNVNIEIDKNDSLVLLQANAILPITHTQRIRLRGAAGVPITFTITYGNNRIGGRNRVLFRHTISDLPTNEPYCEFSVEAQANRDLLLQVTVIRNWIPEDKFVQKIDLRTLKTLPEFDELDVYQEVFLSKKQVVEGSTITLEVPDFSLCQTCEGKGTVTSAALCPKCKGKGKLNKGILSELLNTNQCERCHGTRIVGEIGCTPCKGLGYLKSSKTISLTISAHLRNGEKITLSGMGKSNVKGMVGDLHLVARIGG